MENGFTTNKYDKMIINIRSNKKRGNQSDLKVAQTNRVVTELMGISTDQIKHFLKIRKSLFFFSSSLVRSCVKISRRNWKLRPVVDVIAVSRAFEEAVQPVLESVQELVLEDRQIVRFVQDRNFRLNSLSFDIGLRVAAFHFRVVETHERPG